MNKIVKKVILSVLLISLSTTNTYPIFGFDYIKGFFASTASSLVTNVRQTFTSLFNVFRRRNENKGASQLLERAARLEINRLKEMNGELDYDVEASRNDLQQKSEELQKKDSEIRDGQAEVGRLMRANRAIDRELNEKSDLLQSANEDLLMAQEDFASKSREIAERQHSENERLRHQAKTNHQELQQKDEDLQGANEKLRVVNEINKDCERQFRQIRERQNEIGRLGNLKCITQCNLNQKEDILALSKKNVELQKEINDGLQILKHEEGELQENGINGQQNVDQSISGMRTSSPLQSADEQRGDCCKPENHWLVKAGLISLIPGTAVEVPGDRDLSCSMIELSDNGTEKVINVGSSSNENLQKEDEHGELENGWVEVKQQFDNTMNLYGNYHFTKRLISPSLQDNGKIIFACVHGTFSNSKSFGSDSDKEMTWYLENFAKVLSKCFNRSVAFISTDWSGSSKLEHRKEAGNLLGEKLLKELDDDSRTQIWTFSHSHGANVVAFAAEKMRKHGKKIDCAIHVASPVQDIRDSDSCGFVLPLNAKVLYHFYGTADVTQVIGSVISNCSFNRKLEFNPKAGVRFHNIRLLENGKELDHIKIKKVVARSLPSLLYNIDTYYFGHADLDANISNDDSFSCARQVAIRDKKKFFNYGLSEEYVGNALKHSHEVENEFNRKHKFSIHNKFYGHCMLRRVVDRALAPINEGFSAFGKGRSKSGDPQPSS